jgi:hypothetical protein
MTGGPETVLVGELRSVIPLQVGLMISRDLGGQVVPIDAVGVDARIVLPVWNDVDGKVDCPPGFERVLVDLLPRKAWGDSPGYSQMRINAIAFSVNGHGDWLSLEGDDLPKNFEMLHPAGEDVDSIKAALRGWLDRFLVHTRALLGQPILLAEPVRGVLDSSGVEMLTWIEVNGRKSWLDEFVGGEHRLEVVVPSAGSVLSERIIDALTLPRLVDLANGAAELPLAVELLGDARIAARRQRLRQAISDLGTAAEAAIVGAAPQLAGKTLGGLATAAPSAGIPLPNDMKPVFVAARNAAVHSAVAPSFQAVQRAAEIVDALIRQHLPGFSFSPNPPVAVRQPYQSITMLAPPRVTTMATSLRSRM